MLNGKQKRYLKGLASTMTAVVQVGKSGVNDRVLFSLKEALVARELVKIKVLKNCLTDVSEVAEELANATGAQLVQTIGRNVLLYQPNQDKSAIILPK